MHKNVQLQRDTVWASFCVRIGPKDCSLQLHDYNLNKEATNRFKNVVAIYFRYVRVHTEGRTNRQLDSWIRREEGE